MQKLVKYGDIAPELFICYWVNQSKINQVVSGTKPSPARQAGPENLCCQACRVEPPERCPHERADSMVVVEPDIRVDREGLGKLCFGPGRLSGEKEIPFLSFPPMAICIKQLGQTLSRYTDLAWMQTCWGWKDGPIQGHPQAGRGTYAGLALVQFTVDTTSYMTETRHLTISMWTLHTVTIKV